MNKQEESKKKKNIDCAFSKSFSRHCGRNLCSRCSNNDVPILKFGINKPVRVCAVCFEVLQIGSG